MCLIHALAWPACASSPWTSSTCSAYRKPRERRAPCAWTGSVGSGGATGAVTPGSDRLRRSSGAVSGNRARILASFGVAEVEAGHQVARHGAAPRTDVGLLDAKAPRDEAQHRCMVEDFGIHPAAAAPGARSRTWARAAPYRRDDGDRAALHRYRPRRRRDSRRRYPPYWRPAGRAAPSRLRCARTTAARAAACDRKTRRVLIEIQYQHGAAPHARIGRQGVQHLGREGRALGRAGRLRVFRGR